MTHDPLGDLALTTLSVDALETTAARCGDQPVGTADILVAIIAVDRIGNWDAVQLESTYG